MGIAGDFVLIVIAGLAGGLLARALGLPLLVGYVVAGVAVGPYTAGPTVVQIRDIEQLAEIGAALLLFALGLELSFRDLGPVRGVALAGTPLQILVTGGAAALAGIRLLAMPAIEAVWFGAMISVSSTVVVLKTLSASGVTSTLASRVMIGILMVQDLSVVPMLVILPKLGEPGQIAGNVARAVALAAALLAAVVLLGTRLLPGLLRRILDWGSRELFLVAVVAIGIGLGYATHAAGLSFALGAFVAGLILSESEFSHQALSDVVPVRDLFGLLFFVTVGMLLDVRYAASHAGTIAATVLAIFAGKAVIVGVIARAFGYVNMAPWIVGLGLAQVGEFSFVLARTGLASGMISKPVYDLALTCTVLTMALSPAISALALPLGRAWRSWTGPSRPAASGISPPARPLEGHVIVGGYGRSGEAAAHVLRQAGIPLTVVELNYALYRDLTAAGFEGVLGDVTGEEILEAAGVARARVLLLTVPDHASTTIAVQRARRRNPALIVIARAARPHHAAELRSMGVAAAVQAEFEGGMEMVRQALGRYEHPATAALLARMRTQYYSASDGEVS